MRSCPIALAAAGSAVAALALPGVQSAAATPATTPGATLAATVIFSGANHGHRVGSGRERLTGPDDLVTLDGAVFVAFQNGVGSTGSPSSSGNASSTLVEMTFAGQEIRQWDLVGKIDGLGASRERNMVAATVNEDGNSSLYTVTPGGTVTHYDYNLDPLPHGGGTDAVTFTDGLMLISASAPTASNGPAVYAAELRSPVGNRRTGLAMLSPLFYDNSTATPADRGAHPLLALTDPDSNIAVPAFAPRFGGDFMLDSQGDMEQVYVRDPGTSSQSLSVLALSQSVDDTVFATGPRGTLFATDSTSDTVDAITGGFSAGEAITAVTPCGANSAPSTCPAPGYPANYLGHLDLRTGQVSHLAVEGIHVNPHGLLFVDTGADRAS